LAIAVALLTSEKNIWLQLPPCVKKLGSAESCNFFL